MKIEKSNCMKTLWVLLGLLMLIPGLTKLFIYTPTGVSGMLSGLTIFGIGLFAWAPTFWAWVLIIAEIATGILILARWNLKQVTIIPIIILLVAGLSGLQFASFSAFFGSLGGLVQHLIFVVGYGLLARHYSK